MTNALDNHFTEFDIKLHAVISGAHSKSTGEVAAQWFCATNRRLRLETFEKMQHATVDGQRQPLDLPEGCRLNSNRHSNRIPH